jgi:hypothetical protein
MIPSPVTGAHERHQCGAWEGQELQAEGARGARTWKGRLKALASIRGLKNHGYIP